MEIGSLLTFADSSRFVYKLSMISDTLSQMWQRLIHSCRTMWTSRGCGKSTKSKRKSFGDLT